MICRLCMIQITSCCYQIPWRRNKLFPLSIDRPFSFDYHFLSYARFVNEKMRYFESISQSASKIVVYKRILNLPVNKK